MSQFPEAKFLLSADAPRQFPADTGSEVAFAGRSNAGKSSAINAILNRRGLARASKTPGRTRLVNFFSLGEGQRLVDLPGYGYARVPERQREHWGRVLETYFEGRRSLAGLFLIVDARRLLNEQDRQMLGYARDLRIPLHLLLTKADKLKRGQAAAALAAVSAETEGTARVQLFSATRGSGLAEAREALSAWLAAPAGDGASSPGRA